MSFVNPVDSSLFIPTFVTLGSLLAALFAVVCLIERHHLREIRQSVLFQRWFTWLVIGPIYALGVLAGEAALLLLISVLVLIGLREYGRLVGLPRLYRYVLVAMGLAIGPVALWSREAYLALPPFLFILATLQPLLSQDVEKGTRHLAFAALGFVYLPWLLGHALLLHHELDDGPALLLALGPAVALSDVGAFTVGSLLGRHRLAPVLSPNKTWEGLGGNVVGAYAGLAVMQFALPDDSLWLMLSTLPLVVAVGAIWGDLFESLIKREFAVKDAGSLLPGMGGLLDRIDSLIFVIPLGYYYLRFVT